MKEKEFKSELLLLLAAAIWGFAFVAQRVGAKYVGTYTFNGVRFALGSLSLIPLILYFDKKSKGNVPLLEYKKPKSYTLLAGGCMGVVLFIASSLQQIGLSYTSAGKAGFITGLYIVIVPILGLFLKHRISKLTWMSVILAVVGLYFLSVTSSFTMAKGDVFEIIGAFFWAVHILLIDNFTKKADPIKLSFIQFAACSVLSLAVALITENITASGLINAAIPILYGGICSVGIAYTLQAVAQKNAKPSHAAIILSMESVFASIGGLLILHENLGARGYLGCALMLAGVLLSQVQSLKKVKTSN